MRDTPISEPRREAIRAAILATYRDVAVSPSDRFPYATGRAGALAQGYEATWLDGIPDAVVDRFVGVGNPFSVHRPDPGDAVLDLGCGAGLDVLVAAHFVGRRGRVAGVDVSAHMLDVARHAAQGPAHVELREGDIEDLPFDDASFDAVISNGVLNLVPDKAAAFAEIARVVRPGGVLAAADLLVRETVPAEVLADPAAWST